MKYLNRVGEEIDSIRWQSLAYDRKYCLVKKTILPDHKQIVTSWLGVWADGYEKVATPFVIVVQSETGTKDAFHWHRTEALAVAAHDILVHQMKAAK